MKCTNCKSENPEGSNYCHNCGSKLIVTQERSTSDVTNNNQTKLSLWDKFVEIYDSRGEERKVITDLMSSEAWDLINRLSLNSFEKFIEDSKVEFNKQPYRVIEQLKQLFSWTVGGGYWIKFAQAFYNSEHIKPPNYINGEKLRAAWEQIAITSYQDTFSSITDEVKDVMNTYLKIRIDAFMEGETLKDITLETVDKLKESLVFDIIFGYSVALAEDQYRK